MNKTFLWILIVVVVVGAAALFYLWSGRVSAPSYPANPAPSAAQPQIQPKPVGSTDPDVIVGDLLKSSQDDLTTPIDSDPSLTASSSQAVDAFDQSLDSNQF